MVVEPHCVSLTQCVRYLLRLACWIEPPKVTFDRYDMVLEP
jgi:hypothetical protein